VEVFRLTRKKYAQELSGIGAAKKGARWNSAGNEVIYTAGNRSLAMAEVAVHYTFATLPRDYMMMTITLPDSLSIASISEEKLPADWNQFPHPRETQKIGDNFLLERKFPILKVPSVVTKGDRNFLINPFHSDFKSIRIKSVEQFPFDRRLFE